MSLLKAVKDRGIPLSIQAPPPLRNFTSQLEPPEAYRLRLDVLLRVRGQRRAMDQIERALAAGQYVEMEQNQLQQASML